jgi:hypothetical protein
MKIRQALILPVLVLLAQPELASAKRIHSDTAPPAVVQAVAAQGKAYCSNKTLKGTYTYSVQGYSTENGVEKAFAEAGMESYDGRGNTKGLGSDTENPANTSFSGTYSINPDCTGSINYVGSVYNIYLQPDGKAFHFIDTTAGSVVSGPSTRTTNALIIK